MDDIFNKMKEKISYGLADSPEAKYDTLRALNKSASEITEDKHFTDYLKDKNDLIVIYKLVKNKKLSNNEIKRKLREFLKDPEELKNFLESILSSKKGKKKEESKEAMGAASAGGYSMPLFSTTKGDIVKGVKTVREQLESGVEVDLDVDVDDPTVKKMETKEATGGSSSGQYNQPSIWAKSMNKKDFRGYSKAQYPGGKFVQVKKKCKKFPYCNQGDIKALKIFENESVQNAIESVSSNYGIDKNYISEIVFQEIRKRQN
jgi:hypothetical protein